MDFIKEWTYTICITLIISIFFSILTPKGNMGKFYKMILSVFIFLSFILPLADTDIDISFPSIDIVEQQDSQKQAYEGTINANVNRTLTEGGYDGCRVESDIIVKDNEIKIQALKVYTPDGYDKEQIHHYIFDKLGIVAEVYKIGE